MIISVPGSNDSTPAVIQRRRARPDLVDTLPGPVDVTIRVHATDLPREGVMAWWQSTFQLPQGLTPGTYYLQI